MIPDLKNQHNYTNPYIILWIKVKEVLLTLVGREIVGNKLYEHINDKFPEQRPLLCIDNKLILKSPYMINLHPACLPLI